MKLEERLNNIIEEKDVEIEQLKDRINRLEQSQDLERLRWQLHEYYEETELDKKMPYPRLEMRFLRFPNIHGNEKWDNIAWIYGLVYKYYNMTEDNTLLFIPLSMTTANGGNGSFDSWLREDGKIGLPLRDGVHIIADSRVLNIPAYMVCKEMSIIEKISLQKLPPQFEKTLLKMRRI